MPRHLRAQRFRATGGAVSSSSLRGKAEMRDGAFFNGKEGRVDFRITVRKDGLVFEKLLKIKNRID